MSGRSGRHCRTGRRCGCGRRATTSCRIRSSGAAGAATSPRPRRSSTRSPRPRGRPWIWERTWASIRCWPRSPTRAGGCSRSSRREARYERLRPPRSHQSTRQRHVRRRGRVRPRRDRLFLGAAGPHSVQRRPLGGPDELARRGPQSGRSGPWRSTPFWGSDRSGPWTW